MNVLLISPVNEVGGGEVVILNLVRHRERRDIAYRALVVSGAEGPLAETLAGAGVPTSRVPRGRMANPVTLISTLSRIRESIDQARPDVILANSSQGFLYARWATGGRIPIALYFMSVPKPALWRNHPLDILLRLTPPTALFAASHAIRHALEACGFGSVSTVYHGAPAPIVSPEEQTALGRRLETMGVSAEAPVVLMPGRLQPWKGQLLFVRAFADVARDFPTAHGVCLGGTLFGRDVGFHGELQSEIRRLGLAGRVHLPGHDAIAPWLQRASCVVHASLQADAFPNVCIEALASHRALITNTACGVAEILTAGSDAWVVNPGDSAALAGAIKDVLGDGERAARIAEAGYLRYVEHCTPPKMVRPIEARLGQLAQR